MQLGFYWELLFLRVVYFYHYGVFSIILLSQIPLPYTNSYNCQSYCSLLSEFEENMHFTCFPWVTSYKTQLSWIYKLHWLFFSSSRREQIRTKVIQTATPSTSPHEARLSSSCCLSINGTQGNFRYWIYDSALVRSRDSVNQLLGLGVWTTVRPFLDVVDWALSLVHTCEISTSTRKT